MVYGAYQIICREHPQVYAYTREYQGEHLLVLLNFSATEAVATLPSELPVGRMQPFIGNYPDAVPSAGPALRPYEAQVWRWNG